MEILVFKTNLSTKRHIRQVEISLNQHPHIVEWNVDLHDTDKVLRVKALNITAEDVINIIIKTGYNCEELR